MKSQSLLKDRPKGCVLKDPPWNTPDDRAMSVGQTGSGCKEGGQGQRRPTSSNYCNAAAAGTAAAAAAAANRNRPTERLRLYEPGQGRPPSARSSSSSSGSSSTALNSDAAEFVPANQSWPPTTYDMPPTSNASINDVRCVVEGKSVGTTTDEFGVADYKSPAERSGAYKASVGQRDVTIISRRIVFKFIDEVIWVGANAPPPSTIYYGKGESRNPTAAMAAAMAAPDITEQQQQQQQQQLQQQQQPSWGEPAHIQTRVKKTARPKSKQKGGASAAVEEHLNAKVNLALLGLLCIGNLAMLGLLCWDYYHLAGESQQPSVMNGVPDGMPDTITLLQVT